MGIDVSDKQVDARLKQIKQQYFGGNEKRYQAQLKAQGLTDEEVRADIRSQLVSEQIFKKVTKDVKVSDKDIQAFKQLDDAGVELTARLMSTDRRNDFMQLLSDAKLL